MTDLLPEATERRTHKKEKTQDPPSEGEGGAPEERAQAKAYATKNRRSGDRAFPAGTTPIRRAGVLEEGGAGREIGKFRFFGNGSGGLEVEMVSVGVGDGDVPEAVADEGFFRRKSA
jgi:hypothetical protein